MMEGSQWELKWDLLAKMAEVNRGERLRSCGVDEKVKEGEDLKVIQSPACFNTGTHRRGINLLYLF